MAGAPVRARDNTDEALLFAIRRTLATSEGECIIDHARKIAAAN